MKSVAFYRATSVFFFFLDYDAANAMGRWISHGRKTLANGSFFVISSFLKLEIVNVQTKHVVDNDERTLGHGLKLEELGEGVRLIRVHLELTDDHDEDAAIHRRLGIHLRHNHVHRLI